MSLLRNLDRKFHIIFTQTVVFDSRKLSVSVVHVKYLPVPESHLPEESMFNLIEFEVEEPGFKL